MWIKNTSIPENSFENIVCKMAAILSKSQCIKYIDKLTKTKHKNIKIRSF